LLACAVSLLFSRSGAEDFEPQEACSAAAHRRENVVHHLAIERLLAREHFEKHAAESPDAGAATGRAALGLFGPSVGLLDEFQERGRGKHMTNGEFAGLCTRVDVSAS
jgi:hypothetical protein